MSLSKTIEIFINNKDYKIKVPNWEKFYIAVDKDGTVSAYKNVKPVVLHDKWDNSSFQSYEVIGSIDPIENWDTFMHFEESCKN